MATSARGLQLIQDFEGFAAEPYRCPAGYWTIGYGHVLPSAVHAPVTRAMAQALLQEDVAIAEAAVGRLVARRLTQGQRDALVSFTFNLGAAALQRSTLRRVINRGEDEAVAGEFMRWVWADGRKLPGLVRRRAAEAALYGGTS
ncbi:MAG: lysozyme [Pseudomonadota bacterium]